MAWQLSDLAASGFRGFDSAAELRMERCGQVPEQHGVYLVVRPIELKINILERSLAGRFRGCNPTIPIADLTSRWLPNATVLYIGKAGNPGGCSSLRSRILQYIDFGSGKRAPHWGGRAIWQLDRAWRLLICWKRTLSDVPRSAERDLLIQFRRDFGCLPFANRRS